MGPDHGTAGTGKGIVPDGDTADDFCRVSRDPWGREPAAAVGGLPEGKTGFPSAGHVFHFGIFADGDAAPLAGIVVDVGPIAHHNIPGGIAGAIGIGNPRPLPYGHILSFGGIAPCAICNTVSRSRCSVCRIGAIAKSRKDQQGQSGTPQLFPLSLWSGCHLSRDNPKALFRLLPYCLIDSFHKFSFSPANFSLFAFLSYQSGILFTICIYYK